MGALVNASNSYSVYQNVIKEQSAGDPSWLNWKLRWDIIKSYLFIWNFTTKYLFVSFSEILSTKSYFRIMSTNNQR
jgi:hypothetical protein